MEDPTGVQIQTFPPWTSLVFNFVASVLSAVLGENAPERPKDKPHVNIHLTLNVPFLRCRRGRF